MHEPELRTATLRLRLIDARDAALYRALYTCPRVMAQIGTPLAPAEADAAFERVVAHNRSPASRHRAWAILDGPTSTPRGLLALQRDGVEGEIGLMLLSHAWAPAVARESIAAALAYGFGPAGLQSIWADCRDGPNRRALRRLLEPFGFTATDARRTGHVEWRIDRQGRAVRARDAYPVALTAPSG